MFIFLVRDGLPKKYAMIEVILLFFLNGITKILINYFDSIIISSVSREKKYHEKIEINYFY